MITPSYKANCKPNRYIICKYRDEVEQFVMKIINWSVQYNILSKINMISKNEWDTNSTQNCIK